MSLFVYLIFTPRGSSGGPVARRAIGEPASNASSPSGRDARSSGALPDHPPGLGGCDAGGDQLDQSAGPAPSETPDPAECPVSSEGTRLIQLVPTSAANAA